MDQLLEVPSLQSPPYVISNSVNPPSQRGANLACNILCLAVATLCVLIRMHTKILILRSPGWDDCKQHSSVTGRGRLIFSRCVLHRLGRSNWYFKVEAHTEIPNEVWPNRLCFPVVGLEPLCWHAPMGHRSQQPSNVDKGEPSSLVCLCVM